MIQPKSASTSARYPLRVLVVDDTRVTRWMIASLVQLLGHRYELASDGERAWRMVRATIPDLIVTDWEMPVWTGFDLIAALRSSSNERLKQIPIIVCSTRRDEADQNSAIDRGADVFVTKPVHKRELRLAIENALAVPTHCPIH